MIRRCGADGVRRVPGLWLREAARGWDGRRGEEVWNGRRKCAKGI